ncbi:MAG: hypothetical protein ACP5L4_02615 [Thermoplasmata archaeon]
MKRILAFGIVILMAMLAFIPLSHASYLNVTLYPDKKLAYITMNSVAVLLFSYPNDSMISQILNGTSYNISFSLTYNHPSDWAIKFMEGYIKSRYHNITINNMTVRFTLNEFANSTLLTIYKNTTIDLWLTGIFNKTNNGTKADFSWRSFNINGHFYVKDDDQEYDLNDMLSDMNNNILSLMMKFIHKTEVDTINFSALSRPLSQWNKIYNPSTNTTTFYYNASTNLLLNFTSNDYSLRVIYDPSSTIVTQGYAVATNNSLIIYPNPQNSYMDYILIGISVLAVVGIFSALIMKRKK